MLCSVTEKMKKWQHNITMRLGHNFKGTLNSCVSFWFISGTPVTVGHGICENERCSGRQLIITDCCQLPCQVMSGSESDDVSDDAKNQEVTEHLPFEYLTLTVVLVWS